MKRKVLLWILIATTTHCFSQALLERPVSITERLSLPEFINAVEVENPGIKFFFADEWLRGLYVDRNKSGLPLARVLTEAIEGTELTYFPMFDYAIIFVKDPATEILREEILRSAAEAKKQITSVVIGDRSKFIAGQMLRVSGIVSAETDGNRMPGVTVVVRDLNISSTTNERGEYTVTIPSGNHVVEFSHLNFSEKFIDLQLFADGTYNTVLQERPTILAEVEVSDQAILNSRAGQTSLQITDLKRSPNFVGEADVIKNLQTQAGVTTVGEIAGGFNVRGGGVDQNLVLYDGVAVLNTSHALGFFTAFNADNISNVSFYRGGIPAEYGGRISSVLNIRSKEGDYKRWKGSGGIGIISSHLSAGGPLKEDTTSLALSLRTSYSNWIIRMIRSNYQDLRHTGMTFYDASLKLTHKFTGKTKLTASGYSSSDDFTLADDTVYGWRNLNGSLRLDHGFSPRLFSSFTFSYGSYNYQFSDPDERNGFQYRYGIQYPSLNIDFNHAGAHSISFGLHNTFYKLNPGELSFNDSLLAAHATQVEQQLGVETAFYVSDAFEVNSNFLIEGGLRYSLFNQLGPATIFRYKPGGAREIHNTLDSVSRSGIVKTWHGAEPRLSMRYLLNARTSVKLGYNRMFQYLHLVSNTAAITPVDAWQISNTYFRPQRADQLSVGYFKSLSENNLFEAFVETYYKTVSNVLEFRDGAELLSNSRLETALSQGKARAYGVEFAVAKVKGRFQGSFNYAFARSLRTIKSLHASEEVNNGNEFSSNNDQPHVTNFSWRYGISRRHFFSGNFTYHTGRPMSVPRSGYTIDGVPVTDFSVRNGSRIPDYHRLDIAFIIEGNHRLKKFWDGTWVISFYNVYARKNAYSVFYKTDGAGQPVPYQLAIIGTVIPSVSYSFSL